MQSSLKSATFILLLGSMYVVGARGSHAAGQALGPSSEHQKLTSAKRESIESLASRYVLVALQAWKLDPLPRQMYGIFARVPKDLEAQAMQMPKPTIAGLRAEISELQSSLASGPGPSARREWLASHLRAIDTRLRLLSGERLSLREEARLLFDLDVTPLPMQQLTASRAELERLLPGRGNLNERFQSWINSSRIPDDKIEVAAGLALEESRRRTLRILRLPSGERVTLKFERGVPYSGWAEPQGRGHTVLHINLDRPITLGWLTHLIAHEGYPGHHVALTLLEQSGKRFPERQVLPPLSPSNTLLEGGADAIAASMWTDDETLAWMRKVLLPAIGMTHINLELWRQLHPHIENLYDAVLKVPFLLDEGASSEAAITFLEHHRLTDRRLAEALVMDVRESPFPASFSLINAKHSPAANRLRSYLGTKQTALQRYARLWSTPITPSMLDRVGSKSPPTTKD